MQDFNTLCDCMYDYRYERTYLNDEEYRSDLYEPEEDCEEF